MLLGFLSLASPSSAGQIQVVSAAAVQVIVDGQPLTYDSPSMAFVSGHNLSGTHQLEIWNAWGSVVVSRQIQVPADKRVRLRYKKKQLTEMGMTQMPGGAPPAATARRSGKRQGSVPAIPNGSLEIVGPREAALWVDGQMVPWRADTGSFIATDVALGSHQVRFERDGKVAYVGSVGVLPSTNHRCSINWRWTAFAYAATCHHTLPAFAALSQPVARASGSSNSRRAPPPVARTAPAPVQAQTAAPQQPTVIINATVPNHGAWTGSGSFQTTTTKTGFDSNAPGTLNIVLTDSMDMSNVYVDGRMVHEFRMSNDTTSLSLSPGLHTLEIKDFTEFDVWHRGQIRIDPGTTARVGFSQERFEVYGDRSAWRSH